MAIQHQLNHYTKGNVQLLRISYRYGALTSTEDPNACKAPIAGSANVTPTPIFQ